jgi:hypothetical protein
MADAMKDRLSNWRQLQQLAGITNPDFIAELEAKKAALASV